MNTPIVFDPNHPDGSLSWKNKNCAIIGTSKLAERTAVRLLELGAQVTILHPTLKTALQLKKKIDADHASSTRKKTWPTIDLAINCVVAHKPKHRRNPLPKSAFKDLQAVADVNAGHESTPFLDHARNNQCVILTFVREEI